MTATEAARVRNEAGLIRVWPSRRLVDPLAMRAEDIELVDIANSLARQCRYNGHVEGFVSVAEHCLRVAHILLANGEPVDVVAAGLLHDASEAYLGDIAGPLKRLPLFAAYREVEVRLEAVIAEKYLLPFPYPPQIKAADIESLNDEMCRGGSRERSEDDGPSVDQVVTDFLALAAELGLTD